MAAFGIMLGTSNDLIKTSADHGMIKRSFDSGAGNNESALHNHNPCLESGNSNVVYSSQHQETSY